MAQIRIELSFANNGGLVIVSIVILPTAGMVKCVCVCSKLNQFHYTKNKWHPLKFLDHSENEFELALLHPTSNRCHRIAVSFSVFICQRSLIIYVINETAHRVLTCNFSSLFICIIYDISTEYIHFASLKMFGFWLVIICSVDGQKQLNPTFFIL